MKSYVHVNLFAFIVPFVVVFNAYVANPAPSFAQEGRPAVVAANQSDEEAEIAANLAKLSAEDRKLAEAQKFCPIMADNRLGSMGPPTKIMIKDKPVFLCCKGCRKKALAKPEATLAKVEELKAKNAK